MPTFDASGNVTAVEDTFVEISNLSAGAFLGFLINNLDVGQFRWMSLQVSGSFVGTLDFIASNDKVTTSAFLLEDISSGASVARTTGPGIFRGSVDFRYLSVQFSAWTSGTATAVLELYYNPSTSNPAKFVAFGGGGPPKAASADSNAQVQRVSIYGIGNGSNGDTNMKMAADGTVIVNDDGIVTTAIAAGVTTDTVVQSFPNRRLVSILVTTLGTNAMLIYDNASAGSGKVIGVVPASSPVNGIPLTPRMPAALGITVKGNAANPGVTISYT
jgi:hypothetical protein